MTWRAIAGWSALVSAACAALPASAAPAVAVPQLQASEPRAYGWHLGDVVERDLLLQLPPGWVLVADSLPVPRATGRSLELRSLQRHSSSGQERLQLRYQLMRSPDAPRVVEIAPLVLQLRGPQRSESLRVEAWPLLVSPLVAAEPPNRRGLGPLQPDRPPPWPDDAWRRPRLAAEAALLLAAAAGLARARWGAWWRRRPQRPLAQAARALRRLPRQPHQPDAATLQAALRRVHAALNASAGRVLLADGLDAYCRQHPALAPHRDELQAFLALSDAVFFAGAAAPADSADQLRRWLARWRVAERSI